MEASRRITDSLTLAVISLIARVLVGYVFFIELIDPILKHAAALKLPMVETYFLAGSLLLPSLGLIILYSRREEYRAEYPKMYWSCTVLLSLMIAILTVVTAHYLMTTPLGAIK